jgi:hypothetical protein
MSIHNYNNIDINITLPAIQENNESQVCATQELIPAIEDTKTVPTLTQEDYLNALETLASKGRDGLGKIGDVLAASIGAGAGMGAAALMASTGGGLGATLLGLAGFVVAPSLPLLIGLGVAGAGTGYMASKFIKSGTKQDARRNALKESLRKRIALLTAKKVEIAPEEDNLRIKEIAEALKIGYLQNKISQQDGMNIISLIKKQKITPERALMIIQKMCG